MPAWLGSHKIRIAISVHHTANQSHSYINVYITSNMRNARLSVATCTGLGTTWSTVGTRASSASSRHPEAGTIIRLCASLCDGTGFVNRIQQILWTHGFKNWKPSDVNVNINSRGVYVWKTLLNSFPLKNAFYHNTRHWASLPRLSRFCLFFHLFFMKYLTTSKGRANFMWKTVLLSWKDVRVVFCCKSVERSCSQWNERNHTYLEHGKAYFVVGVIILEKFKWECGYVW